MGTLGEAISAILSKLAQLLGIRPSEQRRFQLMDRKLAAASLRNEDRLEALKDRIRQLEAQVLRKKRQYEEARGDTKRILGGEIERLFRDLDRLQGQEKIIGSNMDRIATARGKLQEYQAALAKGLDEGELDDLALGLQEVFEELKVVDRTTAELDKVAYEAPQPAHVDKEQRMAEVAGETETAGLSAETEQRLRQLEGDED